MSLPQVAMSFLFGIALLQLLPELPAVYCLGLLPVVLFFLARPKNHLYHSLFIAATGFLWALLFAHYYAWHVLPEHFAGEAIWVEGTVSDIPQYTEKVQRFELAIESETQTLAAKTVRLSWYRSPYRLKAGERWRFLVKLKPPHGFANPGGFDYQKWLYQKSIHATGYVKKHNENKRLASASIVSLSNIRQQIADKLLAYDSPFRGIWAALAVGYKGAIEVDHWDTLIATGTNHLMAISGLHIGLIAGFSFWIGRRLLPAACLRHYSADQIAACLALFSALLYALLAGFAIPTQRALIMLSVVFGAVLLSRPIRPGQSLSLALLLVLIFDPNSVLSTGFWFSFLAVAVIAYSFTGRLGQLLWWQQWGRLQWVIALALFPVSMLMFQQASLVAPLANLVLVPWVSFTVVPLVLLSLVFLFVLPDIAAVLLQLADISLATIWPWLDWLAHSEFAVWRQSSPGFALIVLALLGIIIMLLPRGMPHRWMGALLVLPALLAQPSVPDRGAFWVTVLDVGQGLSVFVRTQQHTLLFDAGARLGQDFDLGERVVVPFLRHQQVHQLDKLMISHGDNDHKGGAQAVIDHIDVAELLGQDLQGLNHSNKRLCQRDQRWHWDGVDFVVLHPEAEYKKTNNRACVLRVSNQHHSLLIASDIEAKVEKQLLASNRADLDSDVLLVPHHGSKTSSSAAWIDVVSPDYALVSSGYLNRFGHPDPKVAERYRLSDSLLMNTAESGAIDVRFGTADMHVTTTSHRQQASRYWHHLPLR